MDDTFVCFSVDLCFLCVPLAFVPVSVVLVRALVRVGSCIFVEFVIDVLAMWQQRQQHSICADRWAALCLHWV